MTPGDALYDWRILSPAYLTYLAAWLIGLMPFFMAWRVGALRSLDVVFMLLSPLLLPLFMMGGDWVRWLHFAFFMNATLFFSLREPVEVSVPLLLMGVYVTCWGACHVGCGLTAGAFSQVNGLLLR